MSRRKITTTVYLEPEQTARLKALAERTQVPAAEYIRRGIDLILADHQALLPGQLGLFDPHQLPLFPIEAPLSSSASPLLEAAPGPEARPRRGDSAGPDRGST